METAHSNIFTLTYESMFIINLFFVQETRTSHIKACSCFSKVLFQRLYLSLLHRYFSFVSENYLVYFLLDQNNLTVISVYTVVFLILVALSTSADHTILFR